MAQSTVFPIYLRSEYKEDGAGFKRFQSEVQRNAAQAKRELAGVGAALEQALARPRNAGGSLDLGVDELRRAAIEQQRVAAAARQVAEATKAAGLATGGLSGSMGAATRAAFELANAKERTSREMLQQVAALEAVQRELNQTAAATDLVTQATRRGVLARQGSAGSIGAERAAFVQLGQQMQDVTVQAQLGTSAFVIFGQQVPQAAFALMGLADSTNTTKAAIGRTAAFLAGPWGAAIFAGVAVLGPFVAKLFETEKAADLALDATKSLAEQQADFANFFDLGTGAILEQNSALIANARLKRLDAIEANNTKIKANRAQIREAVSDSSRGVVITGGSLPGTFQSRIIPGSRDVQDAIARAGNDQAAIDRELARIASSGKDSAADAKRIIALRAEQVQAAREVQRLSLEAESLETGRLQAGLRKPERVRRARAGGRTDAAQTRELAQRAQLAESAAERIARLNEAFDESPRLIDRASQATRELDAIIKELGERKPANFEKLIADAQAAKGEVEAALVRPFEQLRQESEQRLQIEALLAAGREDEANALQEVLRLEQQIGAVSAEQRAEIEGIIRAERVRTRELRDQAALFAAQLDVVDQVRRSLTDVLSGRGGDFFGNFRQALQDLQGQRLFEDIFGQAFRDIEEELRGNSPQGRANARYAEQVERTATTTARVEQALDSLADSAETASARLRGGVAANDNGGFSPRMAIAQAALQAAGIGTDITVTGRRPVQIARVSIDDLAKRIGTGVGTSITARLEDLLGPRFAELLGDVIGGAIGGKVLAGNLGAVLGGLQGLTASVKGLEGVSKTLGEFLKGAAAGTQVNALSEALGLGGSRTGAQIGGIGGRALGTLIGGPAGGKIGQLVGAVLGNVVGGLLKSPKRGSATIGGAGGSLDILGTVGNSRALRDNASGLAGSVLESINRIAAQLGAEVNAGAGRVSIGQRKDNLRVDPTGRGATKIGNGAIDFGQDAEAAIAFAVRDLIQDGVITGLKASEQRLIRAGSDIESSIRDVLTFRSVFDRLREIKDPIGFAVEQVTKEFDAFRDVFARAGADAAELASLEELATLERARAIEDATSRIVGSLRGLLDNLRTGDSGLSIRTRRGNAVSEFDRLAARVAAGDSSAFDRFAEVSQQLLDIERQLFGSTQSYFDRLAQVTGLTEQAIAGQTNVTSIAAAAVAPVDDRTAVVRSVDAQTVQVVDRLDTLNANFIALATRLERVGGGGGGGGGFGSDVLGGALRVANF